MKSRGQISVFKSHIPGEIKVKLTRPVSELRHILRNVGQEMGVTETFTYKPQATIVVRVRKVGTRKWIMGFECFDMGWVNFLELESGIEYEVQITRKNEAGESEPRLERVRLEDGDSSGFVM